MIPLEDLLYVVSSVFLYPVLILLSLLFCYCLFALGAFFCQAAQRKYFATAFAKIVSGLRHQGQLRGYPLAQLYLASPDMSTDELDIAALKNLEVVRTVSRLAPMLGLIATMIPMGPALKSLADGNVQGISENLIIAFSAVIIGLIIASITFWIASIKKRWLATELVALAAIPQEEQQTLCEVCDRDAFLAIGVERVLCNGN